METITKPPTGKKLKARAPPPPGQNTAPKLTMEHRSFSDPEATGYQSSDERKENMLNKKIDLTVRLPGGQEKLVNVDGNKAVMDLLVDLCSQYHLNPAQYTLEGTHSLSQQPLTLRPNTLIGTLDMQSVCLKEKITEVKSKKPAPNIPEKTVRLVVNFLATQKAVVRVSPAVPLRSILPAICEKCEFKNEHVTLLKDAISKEELDMSKSLDELGIKELYAWNTKQGKRNLSTSSDLTEKESKGILGFFRSYKKTNKIEHNTGSVDNIDEYEDVFQPASFSGNRFEGFSTAPSSPYVNSHPFKMGNSKSLNNISGIDTKAEMKKRRAPPPPSAAHQASVEKVSESKTTDQLYDTLQNDQKKKRRAPPPPTPPMPNEKTEDKEENRKSSTGNGRQVPQKPPRGNTRSPPHLVIPPPPPYPPPDHDITDPPVVENGADVTEPTQFVPIPAKRGKRLARNSSVSSEEILTVDPKVKEDTGSLNSYTEDSGMVSSPSDSVSLDLQNENIRRKESVAESNVTYNSHTRSDSYNSDDSWSLQTSSSKKDEEVTFVKNGDEDNYIAAQFHDTLAELEDDSEDLDESEDAPSNYASSLSSPASENYNSYKNVRTDATVPVTIIDEIPDVNIDSLKYAPDKSLPQKEDIKPETKIVNSKVEDKKNNNFIFSSNGESLESRNINSYNNLTSDSSKADSPVLKTPEDAIKRSLLRNNYKPIVSANHENGSDFRKIQSPVSPSTDKPRLEIHLKKENDTQLLENKQKVQSNLKTEIAQVPALHNTANNSAEPAKPHLWRQSLYEPKAKGGLTTFTVVPPKPGVKQYDRGASLSASAIKIDDLGNLISPHSSVDKKHKDNNSENEFEGPLVEKAKEFWRSNSMDAQIVESKEQSFKTLASVKGNKQNNLEPEKKLNSPKSKEVTPLTIATKQNDRNNSLQQTKLLKPSIVPQEKMIIIETTSKGKSDLPFQKPHKRTSSQYVASAISKYTETSNSKSFETTESKETKYDTKSLPRQNNRYSLNADEKEESKTVEKQKTNAELKEMFNSNRVEEKDKNNKPELLNKSKVVNDQTKVNVKTEKLSSESRNFNGPQNIMGNKTMTIVEKKSEKTSTLHSGAPSRDPQVRFASSSGSSTNAFLKAVREKSEKIEQANSFGFMKDQLKPVVINEKENNTLGTNKDLSKPLTTIKKENYSLATNNGPLRPVIIKEKEVNSYVSKKESLTVNMNSNESKSDSVSSNTIDEPDSSANSDVFGTKTKFRPVLQKPQMKEETLHSSLMVAIQTGEAKDKLKKIQNTPVNGENKYAEPENERSALLSAIRAQDSMSRLKKVSSAASAELHAIKNADSSSKDVSDSNPMSIPPPPLLPPPPPPPIAVPSVPKFSPAASNNAVDPREELLEAIRSGAGASRLKKVPPSLYTKRYKKKY
ncbi:protein cordon-bleu isoform X2 [Bombina bombina]|uniref:protein cordon-bleu isoform X2 n=1 Tax=Bombina bombina TaxID=8345 RepID=UPI00235AB947|nr:protein cordon-bleu isoform X2 [Bombina bombina]